MTDPVTLILVVSLAIILIGFATRRIDVTGAVVAVLIVLLVWFLLGGTGIDLRR